MRAAARLLSALLGGDAATRRDLLRNGAEIGLLQAVGVALGLLLSIVLARALDTGGYGAYAFALAAFSLLLVIAEAGTPTLLVREIATCVTGAQWARMRSVMTRSTQLVLVTTISLTVAGLLLLSTSSRSMSEDRWQALSLALLLLPFAALSNVLTAILRGLRRFLAAQLVDLCRPLLVLCGVSLLFLVSVSSRTPQTALTAHVLCALLTVLLGAVLLRRFLPAEVRRAGTQPVGTVFRHSLPALALLSLAALLNSQTDILMLGMLRPVEDVGIYRVASQGANLIVFGLGVVNTIAAPGFASLFASKDHRRLQHLATLSARLSLLAAVPLCLAFVLIGGDLIALVFGEAFRSAYAPLAVLSVGFTTSAATGSVGYILNMAGYERDTLRVMLATAVLNVALNAILIPSLGALGAAVATAVSMIIWNLSLLLLVRRRIGIDSTALGTMSSAP